MDKWSILGIDKTDDVETIKKAYRNKLISVNPEDDSEGFMELRDAYEQAVYDAEHKDKADGSGSNADNNEEKDELLKLFKNIYNDFHKRNDIKVWEELFETDYFVSLDSSEEAQDKLLTFLMDNYRLKTEIWKLISDEFDIEKNKDEFKQKYPSDYIEYIIDAANYRNFINFDLFAEDSNFENIDEFMKLYFELKQYVFKRELTEQDIDKEISIIEAMDRLKVYHPYFDVSRLFHELDVMRVEHSAEGNEYKRECLDRLDIAQGILAEYPDDFYLTVFCGDLAYEADAYDTTKKYYEMAYNQNPGDYLATHKLAAVLYDMGDYKRVNDLFIELLDKNPDDYTAHDGLTAANKKLTEELNEKLKSEPDNEQMKIDLSWAYYRTSAFKETIDVLTMFKPSEENVYTYHNLLGRCYYYTEKYDEALKEFIAWQEAIEALDKIDESSLTEQQLKEKKRYPYACFWISECYIGLKEYEKARKYLDISLAADYPEIRYSYETKCKLEYDLGNYEDCLKICEATLEKFNNDYFGYIYQAKSLYELEEYNRTIGLCNEIIGMYPYYYEAYKLEIEIFKAFKQYDDMKNVIDWYEGTGAKSDQIDYQRAYWLYISEDDYNASNEILLNILEKRKNNEPSDLEDYLNVYWLIGENFEYLGDDERAIYYYEEALKDEPDDVFFIARIADNYHVIGNFEKAYEYYDKVLSLSERPNYRKRAYLGKAAALSCMGRYEESIKVYEANRNEYGLDGGYIIDYAELLIRVNNFPACVELLEECIRVSENDSRIQSCLGNLCCFYGNEGYVDEARKMFERAIEHQPDDYLIYRSMGNIYLEHDMYDEAKGLFEKGLELDKDNNAFICETFLIAIGKSDDVNKDEYKRYRDIAEEQCKNAYDAYTYTRAAEMYRGLKEYEKALEAIDKAINAKRKPLDCFLQSTDAWDEKGNIYMELEEYEKALECYKKAVEIFGHYNIYEDKVKKVEELLSRK
ncbi:MAG: tetratricopeptide repeat protein [Lachnospiraceae bacterium]|nr:tetratricopeptide repeat protein [Lachnospiraceae bacterium]